MTSLHTNLHSPPPLFHVTPSHRSPRLLSHSPFTLSSLQTLPFRPLFSGTKKLNPPRVLHFSPGAIRAVDRVSAWDDKPFEILPNGNKSYLDEQDVVSFLDPPKELIPLEPDSYNPASYLWKKIEDVPEERRSRLLSLINQPRLISRAWEIGGMRYEDPKLAKKSASSLLLPRDNREVGSPLVEFYNCRTSGGLWPVGWINFFKKAIFRCNDERTYGRFIGRSPLLQIANTFSPLYFTVTENREVMSTEQPCDLAYEFGDGCIDLHVYPQGFPKPAKHPYPFNDQVVIYIRHIGPGVSVGQAWQEGKELHQVPRKLFSEILMVKDYAASKHR